MRWHSLNAEVESVDEPRVAGEDELLSVRVRRRSGTAAPPPPPRLRSGRVYQWQQLTPSTAWYLIGVAGGGELELDVA